MEYAVALTKAWSELEVQAEEEFFSVSFLSGNYSVDLKQKKILSSSNSPAQDYIAILILHYLVRKIKGLPPFKGEWISFKEMEGGLPYYPAFRKRVIEPILKKYAEKPELLLKISEKFKSKRMHTGDASVTFEVFEGVPVLITIWKGNDEFGPEANMLFDKSIKDIFCTEDVAVLATAVAVNI